MVREIAVPSTGQAFKNNATVCVGTGRMGLALQKEYYEHLKLVQEKIRFKHIRGHGLFCDDVGIYREFGRGEVRHTFYNFTYLDRIIDMYLELGIRPFLELGFMPQALKSGEQSIFYWRANVTPPVSYEKWAALVKATLEHLVERYGRDEVITWPVEVWNEPNIPFWAGTMEEYFQLYDYSAKAVKEVDPRIQVGGPAICGVETEKWLRGFIEHCIKNNSPVDFISRHCYSANKPEWRGHYNYHTMMGPEFTINELKETRAIMADYPLTKELPLHITEFNSSYNPVCPIHDTVFQAAYIARVLSEAGEYADSYSYWTFSDVFEEADVPKAVFHGGFGLVAFYSIKKPTFYTFEFFANAGGELLYRDNNILVTRKGDRYVIIGWNWQSSASQTRSENQSCKLLLPAAGEQAIMVKKLVNGDHANPLQTWVNLGQPRSLNREQVGILQAAAEPLQTDAKLVPKDGLYEVPLDLVGNQLCMVEIIPVEDQSHTYVGLDLDYYGLK
ncbi:MAG: xylan 1,4-beta-xylosidase [Limnochordia bacterium]|jgi:xylan 1,4-beta-xylosidase|nr:xylan 1,4-beta-xylosidase [Bacillota bacterium]HOB08374.1 xylan 1,4-beta-xylosidase [Limnochordia bacterium]NLH32096.1 xylan 1,4-beta-xylosidase [Bacillota bacterium]HPT92508.1 xylan 1,4-beta-xylosidase [Limnochordia bacterium]HPZ30602.1 xylan 1,4-beta-xylosidase [Limnochordia bacterium]